MTELGKAPRRTKSFSLDPLKDRLGKTRIAELTRERLFAFGKARAREGAGPVTLAVDFAYIRAIVAHAAAVHGIAVSPEPITLARIALKRLGLVGPGRERDRRPTAEEIRSRQEQEGRGARVIGRFTNDLRRDFPEMTELSARNLKYMRASASSMPSRLRPNGNGTPARRSSMAEAATSLSTRSRAIFSTVRARR
jgi:hypothetical protein